MEDILRRLAETEAKLLDQQTRINILTTYLDSMPSKIKEQYYQKKLEILLGGSHVKNKYGISDVTTEDSIYEIKRWKHFKMVIGQLKAYSVSDQSHKKRKAVFFDSIGQKQKIEIIELLHKENIEVFEIEEDGDEISLKCIGEDFNKKRFEVDDNFYQWCDEHIGLKKGARLNLKEICLVKFGDKQVSTRHKSKLKKQLEIFIGKRFPSINNKFIDTTLENMRITGWTDIYLKKN